MAARTPEGCEECLRDGLRWVHLRLCLDVRARRMLRLLGGQARDAALPRDRPPGDAQHRAGRGVALVLRGRAPGVSLPEQGLLDAARAGDEDAFRRLVEPLDRQLLAHCYRMLGSLHDAEDAVQETLLRAWRGLPGFEGRASARVVAAPHRHERRARHGAPAGRPGVLPPDPGPPAGAWLEPFPDELLGDDTGRASPDARLRAARGDRAGVRRRAAAPAAAPAGGADPARRARLLGARGGGGARRVHRVGGERPAARPRRGGGAAAGAHPAGDAARAGRRGRPRRGRAVRRGVRARRRPGDRGAADRGRLVRDAAAPRGTPAGATPWRQSWLMPERAPTGLRYVTARANGQVALGTYAWDAEAGAPPADRARRADPPRRPGRGRRRVPHARGVPPLRAAGHRAGPRSGGELRCGSAHARPRDP